VGAHAVRHANGDLAVLLINRSPTGRHDAMVRLVDYAPASRARVYTYAPGAAGIAESIHLDITHAVVQSLPPYSLTVLVLRPAAKPTASPRAR